MELMPKTPSKSVQICCAMGIVLLGLAVRYPHLHDSLWYDEMTTLTQYVMQPWSSIVAARSGEYVPNNHVLHTILVKLVYTDPDLAPPREALLRLPALLAGLAAPLALAWPLRRSDPPLAMAVALVAMLHPWLVDFSVEARGYSLVLLLGIIATNLLPVDARGWSLRYAVISALAIYTIPLAVFLIPAHAVAMLALRRSAIRSWLKGAAIALLLAGLLYLPMYRGLFSYYSNPYETTMTYRQFLDALPRFALTGVAIPNSPAIIWALPVIALVIGSVFGWPRAALRPLLVTFGAATILGALLPLISLAATEARFVPWILPWFCLAVVATLLAAKVRWGKLAGTLGLAVLIGWQIAQDITLLPQQPIREGFQLADRIVPAGHDIMVLYLGARESIALYGDNSHQWLSAPDTASMIAMEKRSLAQTGHLPWVIIFYEKLAMQRDLTALEARGLWTNLQRLYDVQARLPGRLTPVTIYRPVRERPGPPGRR